MRLALLRENDDFISDLVGESLLGRSRKKFRRAHDRYRHRTLIRRNADSNSRSRPKRWHAGDTRNHQVSRTDSAILNRRGRFHAADDVAHVAYDGG